MKNSIKNSLRVSALVIASVLVLASCSEWTDVESLKQEQKDITTQNPELYSRYLASVREYKKSDHKVVLGWFNNAVAPTTRAHHLSDIPDSIDIVSLTNPDNLPAWLVAEKRAIRELKSTRCIYTISYPALQAAWKESQPAEPVAPVADEPEEPVADPFLTFLGSYMDSALALCDAYDYDGITIEYPGRPAAGMTASEKEAYAVAEQALLDKVKSWKLTHKESLLLFEGNPQYLLDREFLASCNYILLPTRALSSLDAVSMAISMARADGVPTDRFVVEVQMPSLNKTDLETGFYGSERAVLGAASWVATPTSDYKRAGLAVYNLQNDYFNMVVVYQYMREAIHTMNPAPKN